MSGIAGDKEITECIRIAKTASVLAVFVSIANIAVIFVFSYIVIKGLS